MNILEYGDFISKDKNLKVKIDYEWADAKEQNSKLVFIEIAGKKYYQTMLFPDGMIQFGGNTDSYIINVDRPGVIEMIRNSTYPSDESGSYFKIN